ncbi:phage tail protein [Streptosporangium sp. CA-135522]|uniref:phage tail protein n=1 Tax=Streptosporangium sp. CA-135522 TaxID=3240072 RepID=UPI003D8FE0D3
MAINIGDLYATLSFRDQMTGPFGRAVAGIKVHASGIHAALIGAGMAATRLGSAGADGAAKLASAGVKSGALLAGVGAAGVAAGAGVALAFAGAVAGIAKLGISAAMAAPAVKAAFGDLKTSVKADMADAASVFEGPLIQAAGSLKTMFSSQIAPALRGMFTDLAPLVGDFTSGLGSFLEPMLPAVSGIVGAVAPMLGQLAGSLGTFGGQIAGFLAPITAVLSQNSGLLATLVTGIGGVLQSLGPVLAALVQVGAQVAGPLMGALTGVGQALATSLAPVLVQLAPVIGQIVGAFGQILVALVPLLPPFLQLAATLASALMPVLVQIAQALASALQPVLVALRPVLALIATAFGQVITALLPILPPLSQLLVALLPPIMTVIKALTPILTLLAGIFAKLVAAVTPFLPPLVQLGTAVLPLILSVVQAVVRLFQGDFKGAFDLIKNAVTTFGATITTAFTKLKTLGTDLVNGIRDGFIRGWEAFKNWVTSMVGDLVTAVKKMLGIASPSKVFAEIGMYSVMGLAKGFKDNEGVAMSAAKSVVAKVDAAARNGLSRVAATAKKSKVTLPKQTKRTIEGATGNGGSSGVFIGGGGFSAGQHAAVPQSAAQVTVHVTNNYPQAEPTSRTVNRGLQYAAAVGLTS